MKERASRAPRFYVETKLREGVSLALPEAAAHHALRVLRLHPGDPLTVFDGSGGEWDATLSAKSTVEVGAWRDLERESPLRVILAQGMSAGEKMDYTVQKAVELGVAAIQPLSAQKSVVRLEAGRVAARVAHWRKIAIAACEQCGRNRIPEIRAPLSVEEYCGASKGDALRLLLSPSGKKSVRELQFANGAVVAAGPEAGFTDVEEAALESAGFMRVRLGSRVLRTETAALAALAALNALAGDF